MKKETRIKLYVTISYVVMIAVNGLANYLPLNGQSTGEISDSYPNLFAPAGFTFAVWGVIYLLLGGFVLYQWKQSSHFSKQQNKRLLEEIRMPFVLTSILNAFWLFCWHYEYIALSTVFMVGLLGTLIYTAHRMKNLSLSFTENLFLRIPFGTYFGWITVATVANITVTLVKWKWTGFGLSDLFWTVAVLLVSLLIASITMYTNKDLAYGAVIIWAYWGIASKHRMQSGWNNQYPLIVYTAFGSIAFVSVVMLVIVYKKIKRKTQREIR